MVCVQVRSECTVLGEVMWAHGTLVGPFSRVRPQVALEVALVRESAGAQAALERALARVGTLVHNEAALVHRGEGALATPELAPSWNCHQGWRRTCRTHQCTTLFENITIKKVTMLP